MNNIFKYLYNTLISLYFLTFIVIVIFSSNKYLGFVRLEDFLSLFSLIIIFLYRKKISSSLFKYIFFIIIIILFYSAITTIYHFFLYSEIIIEFSHYKDSYIQKYTVLTFDYLGYPLVKVAYLELDLLLYKFFPITRLLSAILISTSFYLYFSTKTRSQIYQFLLILFIIIFSFNFIFIYYQFYSKNFFGYHGGVGIIGEDSPFIASYIIGFILMLAHLLYQNNFNIYLKGLFFIIFVSILIAIISIDSRTQILFSIFYFVFYFFFSMKFLNKNFLFFLLICLIIFIILFPQFQFKGQDFDFRFFELNLFETKLHDANARYGNWLMHLNDYFLFCKSFPLLFITGLGFGGNYIIYNTISSASDNNYLSFFYQTGLFGIIAIYALIILYLLKIFKNISIHNYDIFCKFLSFFIASLLISFNTHELLFVGKSNFLFLILISIYNLLIYRINKNE